MTRITNAADAWDKAAGKLEEAEKADPAATPGAVVHCAYYAMHHGARAVLLARTALLRATTARWFGNSDSWPRSGRIRN